MMTLDDYADLYNSDDEDTGQDDKLQFPDNEFTLRNNLKNMDDLILYIHKIRIHYQDDESLSSLMDYLTTEAASSTSNAQILNIILTLQLLSEEAGKDKIKLDYMAAEEQAIDIEFDELLAEDNLTEMLNELMASKAKISFDDCDKLKTPRDHLDVMTDRLAKQPYKTLKGSHLYLLFTPAYGIYNDHNLDLKNLNLVDFNRPKSREKMLRTGVRREGVHRSWTSLWKSLDENTVKLTEKEGTTYTLIRETRRYNSSVYIVDEMGFKTHIGYHNFDFRTMRKIDLDHSTFDLVFEEYFCSPRAKGKGHITEKRELMNLLSAIVIESCKPCPGYQPPGFLVSMLDFNIAATGFLFQESFHIESDISVNGTFANSEAPRVQLDYMKLAIEISRIMSSQSKLVIRSLIANVLAIDEPYRFVNIARESKNPDLDQQETIFRKITHMNPNSLNELSELSYNAVIYHTKNEIRARAAKIKNPTFKEKASIIRAQITKMFIQEKYAFPPLPSGELRRLDIDYDSFAIYGHAFSLNVSNLASGEDMQKVKIPNAASFLKDFPAVGLLTTNIALASIAEIDNTFLTLPSPGIRGPVPEIEGLVGASEIWAEVSRIYSLSPICQFHEIRRDLALAVYRIPPPKQYVWQSKLIYDGHAMLYYSLRDSVMSANGYRVDWFICTQFSTIGSIEIKTQGGKSIFISPRQKSRSQELDYYITNPHRLKLVLFSMLSKREASHTTNDVLLMAWQRIAFTAATSTWYTGGVLKPIRYLSSALANHSSPFEQLAKKLKPAKTVACLLFYYRLDNILRMWTESDQYIDNCPILGLPRSLSQLESYWELWCPYEIADHDKHMLDCCLGIYDEAQELADSMSERKNDLIIQSSVLSKQRIEMADIVHSIQCSMRLKQHSKFGWNVFGMLASAFALNKKASVARFDDTCYKTMKRENLLEHMTVRHSARIDEHNNLKAASVAETIIDTSMNDYLSVSPAINSFLGSKAPVFINHPKNGEHIDREISIADPCSRICLNRAESTVGSYGKTTQIDMLKVPNKDSRFLKICNHAMRKGGCVQSSDASRYAPHMSNVAIGIHTYALGVLGRSECLKEAGVIYYKLGRKFLSVPDSTIDSARKRIIKMSDDEATKYLEAYTDWVAKLDEIGTDSSGVLRGYQASSHMGQGMSHHGSSLMHSGALLLSVDIAKDFKISFKGEILDIICNVLVTSDDSTIVAFAKEANSLILKKISRADKQRICHKFMEYQRKARSTTLWLIGVTPNLGKERVSGFFGEFNSNDTGLGCMAPIYGFRELISQLCMSEATSLVGDFLNAYYYARSIALAGQDMNTGIIGHRLMLDLTRTRWQLHSTEIEMLANLPIIPRAMIIGCDRSNMLNSPSAQLSVKAVTGLLAMSRASKDKVSNINLFSHDSIFAPMMVVSTKPKKIHRSAIKRIEIIAEELKVRGRFSSAFLMEDMLVSLILSARTRTTGRVILRIRNKVFNSKAYYGMTIGQGPFIDCTLNWLDMINSIIMKGHFDLNYDDYSDQLRNRAVLKRVEKSFFPAPPEKFRFPSGSTQLPEVINDNYGATAYGSWAKLQIDVIKVSQIDEKLRKQVINMMIYREQGHFPEFVMHNQVFVIDWLKFEVGIIEIKNDNPMELPSAISITHLGLFDALSIIQLRVCEEATGGQPVLAFHSNRNGTSLYHCFYRGISKVRIVNEDIESKTIGDFAKISDQTGQALLCYYQGSSDIGSEETTMITKQDVDKFVKTDNIQDANAWIKKAVLRSIGFQGVDVASESCIIKLEEFSFNCCLTYDITSNDYPKEQAMIKAKMIADYMMDGYWHRSAEGYQLRAFMKGAYGHNSIWVGAVFGWEIRNHTIPDYSYQVQSADIYSRVIIAGSVREESQLRGISRSKTSRKNLVIKCESSHPEDQTYIRRHEHTLFNIMHKFNRYVRFGSVCDHQTSILEIPHINVEFEEMKENDEELKLAISKAFLLDQYIDEDEWETKGFF